ncbi:unnamed protein product [Caenorhabditis brenneri]
MTSIASTSSSLTFIPRFCPFLNKDIIFVRQKSGTYLKFQFDQSKRQFLQVRCPDCRVIPIESDLVPLYPAWSNRLERYIIFVENLLNNEIEQYVYDKEYEGFQQVYQPEIRYDPKRSHDDREFFTVGGTEEEGVTVIKRDSKGRFRKEQMDWGTRQFRVMKPVPVRVLGGIREEEEEKSMMQSNRKRKTECEDKENKEIVVIESDESDDGQESKKQRKPEVEIVAVNRSRLSHKDILEIRRLAALMGNPTEAESSDEVSYTDYDDVPDDLLFDVVESSC